jgi:hypothetical protein
MSLTSCTCSHASFDPSLDQSKVAIDPLVKCVSWRGDDWSSDWSQMFDAPPTPSMKVSERRSEAQWTTRSECVGATGRQRS